MTAYRLKAGHVTKAVIEADANAVVASFPGAAYHFWAVGDSGIVTPYARRVTSLGEAAEYGLGRMRFSWMFQLNDAMYQHLWSIAGSKYISDVTVVTRSRPVSSTVASQWVCLNCKMRWPDVSAESLDPRDGYAYANFRLTFTGVIAPSGA